MGLFERTFCISLKRRQDRRKRLMEQIARVDWKEPPVEFIDAIDGRRVLAPRFWKVGDPAWGCYRTHLYIIEKCLNENIKSVLILEDDAELTENFEIGYDRLVKNLPDDWQWVYLGGQHLNQKEGVPEGIAPGVCRPFNCHRNHAYGIRNRNVMQDIYRFILEFPWPEKFHLDHRYGMLHEAKKFTVYAADPFIVRQAKGFSDIEHVNHQARGWNGDDGGKNSEYDIPGVGEVLTEDVAFGRCGLIGRLGFENRKVDIGREYAHMQCASAHAPSFLKIRLDVPCRVFGALNQTSLQTNEPVVFLVDDQKIGEASLPYQRTATKRIEAGEHLFKADIGKDKNYFAHSVWCFDPILEEEPIGEASSKDPNPPEQEPSKKAKSAPARKDVKKKPSKPTKAAPAAPVKKAKANVVRSKSKPTKAAKKVEKKAVKPKKK